MHTTNTAKIADKAMRPIIIRQMSIFLLAIATTTSTTRPWARFGSSAVASIVDCTSASVARAARRPVVSFDGRSVDACPTSRTRDFVECFA